MTAVSTAAAVGFGDRPTAPKMRLVNWRSLAKGSLRRFATIRLPIGLKISDCPVFVSNGKANLPSKPQLGTDGQHRRDINGKPLYVGILEWRDRDLRECFSDAVVALVRVAYPDALEADGEP